eukprot:jgi/Chlat1/853/Chrsp104S01192
MATVSTASSSSSAVVSMLAGRGSSCGCRSLRPQMPGAKQLQAAASRVRSSRTQTPTWRRSIRMEAAKQAAVKPTANDEVDAHIQPYCDIKQKKKTLGEMENEFLQALQSFYYDKKPMMSNEEFDNLKDELMWEGSSVVVLSTLEQKFLEASMSYQAGKPIVSDEEFDVMKQELQKKGSPIAVQGPRCSLRSKKVYSDARVDYLRMLALNVPAALAALALLFVIDDASGFRVTQLVELPEPYGIFIVWLLVLPAVYYTSQALIKLVLTDPLVLQGPCPNCGHVNNSFFGAIFGISSGESVNTLSCESCKATLTYNRKNRRITLESLKPPGKSEGEGKSKPAPKKVPAKAPAKVA